MSLKGADFYINSDTLTNMFFILRSRKKIPKGTALKALEQTTIFCEIVSIEKGDMQKAINLCEDRGAPYRDHEDAIQYMCAKKIGATIIVTNDKEFVSLDIEL